MRQEEIVIGLERRGHDRGLLEQNQEDFEAGDAKAHDEQVAESRIEDRSHQDDVRRSVQAIFERRPIELDQLELSAQERSALEALRSAFDGKDARYHTFVYAEQRRELLEQALSALQPIFALDVSMSSEMQEEYAHLVEQVSELREHLVNLEDAQDDEMLQLHALREAEEGADDGDKDDEEEDDDDDQSGDPLEGAEDEPARRPSTLEGPEVAPRAAVASTLFDGPAVERPAVRSTLTEGPALPERIARPSAAFDGGAEGPEPASPVASGPSAAGVVAGVAVGVAAGVANVVVDGAKGMLSRIGNALGLATTPSTGAGSDAGAGSGAGSGGQSGKSDDGGKGSS